MVDIEAGPRVHQRVIERRSRTYYQNTSTELIRSIHLGSITSINDNGLGTMPKHTAVRKKMAEGCESPDLERGQADHASDNDVIAVEKPIEDTPNTHSVMNATDNVRENIQVEKIH